MLLTNKKKLDNDNTWLKAFFIYMQEVSSSLRYRQSIFFSSLQTKQKDAKNLFQRMTKALVNVQSSRLSKDF